MAEQEAPAVPWERAPRWIAAGLAMAVLGYAGWAVWRGIDEVGEQLAAFDWSVYPVVLALTLVNYGLRYAKWHWLLARVGAPVPHRQNLVVFVSGLAMVLSPAKAGELLKPWLVKRINGTPMVRTIPVLVTERLTDGIAVIGLAAVSISASAGGGGAALWGSLAVVGLGVAVLSSETLTEAVLRPAAGLPVVGRFVPRVSELLAATRTCTTPFALLVTLAASVIAWGAECVGYWLILGGFGLEGDLLTSTWLYASATVFGGPSPGGLGLSDAALGEGAALLVRGMSAPQAIAAAMLIRVATLWLGVGMGALALGLIPGLPVHREPEGEPAPA